MNTLRIILFAAIMAIATAQCGSGLQSCSGQCYSPLGNSCPTDQVTLKSILCPLNYAACNGACYSPSQYHCANGGLQAGAAVTSSSAAKSTTSSTQAQPSTSSTVAAATPSTTSSIPKSTTSSTQAQPSTSSTVAAATPSTTAQTCNTAGCGAGTCNCNGACYTPGQYSCPVDSVTGKNLLCWGNSGACNGQCYDATLYSCKNGGLVQGAQQPTPQPTSSSSTVKTTSSTSLPTSSVVTQAPTTSSTATPSSSASQQTCNTAGCGAGTCNCNGACYTPGQYSCPVDSFTGKNLLCWGNSGACNGQCYDATLYSCKNGGLVQGAQQPTPTPTSSSTVNAPATSSVPTTSSVPSTVKSTTSSSTQAAAPSTTASTQTCNTAGCGVGTCNCNGACYTPGQYNCPLDPYTGKNMLCYGSFAACNGQCYDTSAYSCKSGAIVQGASQNTGASYTGAATTNTGAATSSSTPAASTTSTPTPVVNPNPVPNKYPTQTADLRIINNCKSTLWFEARYGNQGAPIPGATSTATIALPGSYVDYVIPSTGLPGSRFWAKYGCDSNGKNCLVGDQMQYWPNPPGGCPANGCTPPVDSLFEATWGCRPGAGCNSQNPTTWFDTSQVDGWTIPYKLTPNGDTSGCDCIGTQCGFKGVDASRLDLARCPRSENLVAGGQTRATVNGNSVDLSSVDLRIINNGSVLGCLSPCKRLNWGYPYGLGQEESSGSALWMCCPTPTPDDCSPATGCVLPTACRTGPIETTQFVAAVHDMAPGIYSYSYDDGVGLHACPAGVVTYTMEFCPAGSSAYPSPA